MEPAAVPAASSAARWSQLHHGIDPAAVPGLLRCLRALWWLALPLVRLRVPPTAITVLGLLLAVDAALLAGSLPSVAAACVVLAVVCDGLDGAVAVVGGGASAAGALADAVADRLSDMAFAIVIWRCGAPWWLALVAGAAALSVDGLRRLRRVPDRITVGERPTWAICATLACLCATVTGATWPPTVCAGVAAALGLVALAQLSRT